MSRAKTRETLATGNLLSVINVLMQLRKVCNHPNLFEVRPTVSPFEMEGLTYHTASLVWSALHYDPFKHVDLFFLNLLLLDLEFCLTAFGAHRIRKYCTKRKLIEEIDSSPELPPRCPSGKIKIHVKVSANVQQQRPGLVKSLPLNIATPKVGTSPLIRTLLPQTPNNPGGVATLRVTGSTQFQGYSVQLVQHQGGVKAIPVAALGPTQQVEPTVLNSPQVKQPDGVQRFSVPAGFAQLVQTSTGRHILLTSSPQVIQPLSQNQSLPGTTTVLTASGQRLTVLSKGVTGVTTTTTTVTTANRTMTPGLVSTAGNRPVMRVPPLNMTSPMYPTFVNSMVAGTTTVTTTTTLTPTRTCAALTQPMLAALVQQSRCAAITQPTYMNTSAVSSSVTTRHQEQTRRSREVTAESQSVFFLPELTARKEERRKEKLQSIASFNDRRCTACPIYGSDLVESLTMHHGQPSPAHWRSCGYVHCLNAQKLARRSHLFWTQTDALVSAIHSPQQLVQELRDIFSRFVLYVPAVAAPLPKLHVSHPPPSRFWELKRTQAMLQQELSSRSALLHPIASAMMTQFPDPRLIQYDCGKLQVLDGLLRQLKLGQHRALIFTQMTRMLDVLEAFLNFHGYIYLRLDGTTRIDQRQLLMERFNADRRIFCFILSTRSGGIGVNLTGADTVIFYDSDWNPTMDAQAQDRCHRIGQTRDVHIYRLVSEMTVEENILKKANQKRLLGDLAIEGGNFTTAYFKSTTIQDLFNVDVGEQDASRRMAEVLERESERERRRLKEEPSLPPSPHDDRAAMGALETALAAAEDDTDVQAARTAKAEAAADLAEFDETIPLEDADATGGEPEMSKVEQELLHLEQQLTPVERYAIRFIEEKQAASSAEQLAAAEAEIEQQKREWELGRLQALREEEDRHARLAEDDDQMLTFSREDAHNQVNSSDSGGASRRRKARKHTTTNSDRDSTSDTSDSDTSDSDSDDDFTYTKSPCINNHTVSPNSPRTRSRGTVSINLWTLDVSPILPGVKPVGAALNKSENSPSKVKGGSKCPKRRKTNLGAENQTISPGRTSGSEVMSSPPTPYPNPNLVIRTRRASTNPTSGDTVESGDHSPAKKGAKAGRVTRRSESSIEGNDPVS